MPKAQIRYDNEYVDGMSLSSSVNVFKEVYPFK